MIIKTGNRISFSESEFEVLDNIPAGNWLVAYHPKNGFYLEGQEDFTLPEKIYGEVHSKVERYLNTFSKRNKNLGIMLNGLKGTGKSLLAKALCIKSELPTILITQPYIGVEFENFLATIKQECVVFVDEFEKVYNGRDGEGSQDNLLSILDGIFEGKKIFLLTANYTNRVNSALKNRPSRVHYLQEYTALSDEVISEVIDDILVDTKEKEGLIEALQIVGEVNMDILVSLIEEMNMYDESARESLRELNIKPEGSRYEVSWIKKQQDGEVIKFGYEIKDHPLTHDEIYLEAYMRNKEGTQNYYDEVKIKMAEADYNMAGSDIIINQDGIEYKFSKKMYSHFAF